MPSRIGLKALAQLCRRASTSLTAGIDARRYWQGEAQRSTGRAKRAMTAVSQAIAAGDSTHDALAAAGNYFPPGARELVAVGEESGRLAEVFRKLADHYEHMLRLRRMLLAGLIWPAIELMVALFVVGLLIYVTGFFTGLDGQPVDLLGLGLVGGRGLVTYLAILAVLAVLATFLLFAWQQEWAAGRAMAWLAERTPALGHTLKMLGLTRFTWSLAMTLGTGMDVRRGVALAVSGSQWGPLRRKANEIDDALAAGGDIHDALCTAAGVLPEELLHTVAVGEQAGTLSESLEHLSTEYAQKAEAASTAMAVVVGFLLLVLVGLLIIAIIFRLAMFYIGTINDLIDETY